MTNIEKLYQSIENEKQRSAWNKGVTAYALELVKQLGEQIAATVDGLKDQLKQIMQEQNTDTLTGTEHKATYKAVTSSRIDTTALKRELPGVAAQYTRATETRRFTFS